MDDSISLNSSIEGKIVSMEDIPTPASQLSWDSSLNDSANYDTQAIGALNVNDGSLSIHSPGNTQLIIQKLNSLRTNNQSDVIYAAQACVNYRGGAYTDWYLPAVCEMGYSTPNSEVNAPCTASIDNMQSRLVDTNYVSIYGEYWSSTESVIDPMNYAWYQTFFIGGGNQNYLSKYNKLQVRCVRKFS